MYYIKMNAQVLAYIESGGNLNRRLCAQEVSVLSHDNSRIITPGMLRARDTLVEILKNKLNSYFTEERY